MAGWPEARAAILACDPLYQMMAEAQGQEETYRLVLRLEINSLFKDRDKAARDLLRYADIARDLDVYGFAAMVYWNILTAVKPEDYAGREPLEDFLYCLEQLGVKTIKENFRGDHAAAFARIKAEAQEARGGRPWHGCAAEGTADEASGGEAVNGAVRRSDRTGAGEEADGPGGEEVCPMQWTDWKARFPELRPIESVPLLWSVEGCGLRFYGRRDDDEETGSYVQTYGLCLLGIPVWNLGAYLFAEFSYGYDVVGRLPLSRPARTGNAALITMILLVAVAFPIGLGLWALNRAMHNLLPNFDHRFMPDLAELATIGKPDEFARQRLAKADELAAAGKAADSARLCRQVAQLPRQSA